MKDARLGKAVHTQTAFVLFSNPVTKRSAMKMSVLFGAAWTASLMIAKIVYSKICGFYALADEVNDRVSLSTDALIFSVIVSLLYFMYASDKTIPSRDPLSGSKLLTPAEALREAGGGLIGSTLSGAIFVGIDLLMF